MAVEIVLCIAVLLLIALAVWQERDARRDQDKFAAERLQFLSMLSDERKRAELLWGSKSVGEFREAQNTRAPRTFVPDDEYLAAREKEMKGGARG